MGTKLLYALALPERNQDRARGRRRRNQAESGTLGAGTPSVQSISLEPGEKLIRGGFGSEYGDIMAAEFEELFGAEGIEEVPYSLKGSDTSAEDGYYTLRDVEVTPDVPDERRIQQFDGTITRVGDRNSHYRALETNVQTVDNPFGSATTANVTVHNTADRIRWQDPTGGAVEQATESGDEPTSGPSADIFYEHGDVEWYDALDSSFTDPKLIYDIPYDEEWKGDTRVWDDYGRSKTDTIDGTSVPSTWQRVFAVDHSFQGNPIVETQHLRVEFDLANNQLVASNWDGSSYTSISLGSSDWQLYDYRFTHIGLAHVDAILEFEDTSSAGTYYRLEASFMRGRDLVLFVKPDNATSLPAGLNTRLDPIADDSDRDPYGPGPAVTAVPKTEVSF